ncbi:TrmH family RNA methyltransferase [Joostella sp.]|uniref:TrmH family RNA methyltransferase n=1 Tax=Joostella sp. TaxID=2231138 RepID=UPI003A8DA15A
MVEQLNHDNNTFKERSFPVTIICDHVTSASNIGSIFRLADAFGVEKIIFIGVEPVFSRRVEKTARATHKFIPYEYIENEEGFIVHLKEENYTIIALEITNNSKAIENLKIPLQNKTALLIGNENYGVSQKLLSIANHVHHIEMFGKNSSMNLAQATAISLYEITNRYRMVFIWAFYLILLN